MKKRYWIPLVALVALPFSVYLFLKHPVFGARPSADEQQQFFSSTAFNKTKGVFENRRPALIAKMYAEVSIWEIVLDWFAVSENATPSAKLPELVPDIAEFVKQSEHTKLIWLGHSSFLLNISGTIVLVDPIFSPSAAPLNFLMPRFQPAVVLLEQLPAIDVILISHDHYDHLDRQSVQYFADKQTQFVTPLGVGVHLKRWGIAQSQIVEKNWWESHAVAGIEFTAAPAQHFSGRDGINKNETLWASWILISDQSRLYFSGDSGYDIHFKEIGTRFGPFDLSIMENGQYDEAWSAVHMFPKETLQAHKDVKAKRLMPVHWGMFEMAYHPWYEPVERLSVLADAQEVELLTPLLGEIIMLNDSVNTQRWWQKLIAP